MKIRIFVVLVLFLGICIPGASLSQTRKVVVIPLTGTVETPLEPFDPVAADNPPNSDYTIGTDTVTDRVTGLQWQKWDLSGTKTWGEVWDDYQELDLAGKQD